MRMTLDLIEKQITEASQAYYDRGLESFFLPKEGDKHLYELIQDVTIFDEVKLISSYCYGSMREFELTLYSDRAKKRVSAKMRVTVDYDITDGTLNKINVRFGI